jgi:cell pole-organizing protein PopZ
MSDAKSQQEPSMEEILASIRRIISDDNEPPPPAKPVAAVEDDVLELTQFAPPEVDLEIERDMEIEEVMPEVEPEPPVRPHFNGFQEQHEDRLVSDATAAVSSAAFASVSERLQRNRRERDVPVGNGAATLEDIVKDVLRPFLRDWLDQHLPDLVERVVREEVERLARDGM